MQSNLLQKPNSFSLLRLRRRLHGGNTLQCVRGGLTLELRRPSARWLISSLRTCVCDSSCQPTAGCARPVVALSCVFTFGHSELSRKRKTKQLCCRMCRLPAASPPGQAAAALLRHNVGRRILCKPTTPLPGRPLPALRRLQRG